MRIHSPEQKTKKKLLSDSHISIKSLSCITDIFSLEVCIELPTSSKLMLPLNLNICNWISTP